MFGAYGGLAASRWRYRPLYLIGECPPKTLAEYAAAGQHHSPLYPLPRYSAGGRLFRMSGYGLSLYIHGLQRHNLLPDSPGKRWPGERGGLAEQRATVWRNRLMGEHAIAILFGRRVADAFQIPSATPWFRAQHWGEATVYPVPHTSGRSTTYNEATMVLALEAVFALVKPHAQCQLKMARARLRPDLEDVP